MAQAKARVWPCLSYMCRIRSTAEREREKEREREREKERERERERETENVARIALKRGLIDRWRMSSRTIWCGRECV